MDSLYNFLCSENDIFLCYYFLDKLNNYNNNKILIYKNVLMKSAIKIDDDFLVFKSNKVASKGMSQLLLYNFRVKKDISYRIKTEEDYSFIFSPLGQTLIAHKFNSAKEDIGNRILLFACKKYIKGQKNGILLFYNMNNINNLFEGKKIMDSYFYNTNTFEPYCICPFLINESKYIIDTSDKIKETDYFLVGGFDKKRKQGMIKIYKIIIYDEKLSIEFIQDIKLFNKDFKGFNGPISSIIQSKEDGNLLITCWDGNVFLVEKPDIRFYLKQDEQIKKSAIDFFLHEKSKNYFS